VDAYQRALTARSPENSDVALRYGYPIGTWNVSQITNFTKVFDPERSSKLDVLREQNYDSFFNEDISGWDMSNAVTLRGMFAGATRFAAKDLNTWQVHKVTDFSYTFFMNTAFNGNISSWNTSSAVTMNSMVRSLLTLVLFTFHFLSHNGSIHRRLAV